MTRKKQLQRTEATAVAVFAGALAVGSWALYVARASESDTHADSSLTYEAHADASDTEEPPGGGADEPDVGAESIGESTAAVTDEGKKDQPLSATPVPHMSPTARPDILRVLEDYILTPLPGADPQALTTVLQRIVENDSAFATEAIDSPWARRTESEIAEAIAQIKRPELVTLQVECRSLTCRVQLAQRVPGSEHLDRPSPSVREFHNELNGRLDLEPGWWTLSVDRNGAAHSVAYLKRPHSAL